MLAILLMTALAAERHIPSIPPSRDPLKVVRFDVKTMHGKAKERSITVALSIADQHHVIANPAGHSDFESSQIRVVAKGKNPPALTVAYPPPTTKLKYVGEETVNVYQGTVRISISYQAEPDTLPFVMVIRFQVETATICYFPGRFTVPVEN